MESEDYDTDDTFHAVETFLDQPLLNSYCKVSHLVSRPELLSHPFEYMTTLVQLGYEPLPPKLTKSIFGRTQLQLPGFLTYMKYIAKTDGFFGIYRGLRYHIAYTIAHRFVFINVNQYQKQHFFPELKEKGAKYKSVENLALSIACDSVSTVVTLTVTYPIHLMMVRAMAQFIGREQHYDSVFSAIADIFQTGGISGFYAGFVPFVLGECGLVALEASLAYLVYTKLDQFESVKNSTLVSTVVNIIARSFVYPFRLVSTVMSCNGSNARSLAASAYTAPEYRNWVHCCKTLWSRGEIKRGSSLWWRYQPITSSLMFPMQPLPRLPKSPKEL